MEFIIVLIFSFLLIVSIVHDPSSKRIVYLFFFFWVFVLFMASIGVMDLYKPSSSTILILSIGVLAFVVGFSCIKIEKTNKGRIQLDVLKIGCNRLVNNSIFKALTWILLLYSLFLLTIYLTLLSSGLNLGDIRTSYYSENIYGPGYNTIHDWILIPYIFVARPIFGFQIVFNRNKNCVPIGVILVVDALLSGGRFSFVYMVLPILCALFFYNDITASKIKLSVKQYFYMALLVISAFFVLIMLSAGRRTQFGSSNFFEVAVEEGYKDVALYSVGPTAAFDYAINNNYVQKMGGYQYGALTLSGLETIPFVVANRFGGAYHRPLFKLAEIIQDQQIEIGYNIYWNALYTWCLYFYLDFGLFGIILFPFLYGLLMRIVIKRFYFYRNIESFMLVGIFFFITIMSPISHMLSLLLPTLIIIYLFNAQKKRMLK